MNLRLRVAIAAGAGIVALIASFMPLFTGERNIGVHTHHIDHAVLMLFGVIIGLAVYRPKGEAISPLWLWLTLLPLIAAMVLMSPALYAIVDARPIAHSFGHLVFVILAALCAYAGQRYVRGVGWMSAFLLEIMAFAAAFGYGIAPR